MMTVPLDYNERQALHKQQPRPEQVSPTWKRLLTEAEVKFHTGLAPSMPAALAQVAKEQPALYEEYRQEQLAACGPPVAKVQKEAPPEAHPAVRELEARITKVLAQAPSLTRPEAWSQVMRTPEAQALYKSYRAQSAERRS
jgi:hypothetical protein